MNERRVALRYRQHIKGIKQCRLCFYPVSETRYDEAKHEKVLRENEVKPSFLSALRVNTAKFFGLLVTVLTGFQCN